MSQVGDWSGRICAVTGGCGGYGAFLVRALVRKGAQVRVLDMRRDDHIGSLAEAEAAGKAKFISCNLCASDQAPLKEALKDVSVIFHTVAYFGDPAFTVNQFANPGHAEKMQAINITAVEQLMAVARECGVKAFVHTSSTNVIFPSRTPLVAVTEDHPYPVASECIDLYSLTKGEAERRVIAANGKGGMYTAAVRPNGIYGPTERSYAILKILESATPMGGLYVKMLTSKGKEPIADWCHVENLALVQMLAAKHMLDRKPNVCGNIFNASDDTYGTNSEFFAPILRGAGLGVGPPFLPLPAAVLQGSAYMLEASCWLIRRLTGWRTLAPPLNCVEAAKATIDNYQLVDKAKRELGFVAIPQAELMKGMAAFSKAWYNKNAAIPPAPLPLWLAIGGGMSLVIGLSFADVRRWDGAPWKITKDLLSKAIPSVSSMGLDAVQRKVFRIGLCLPMIGVHSVDALIAAYLARRKGHLLWMRYGLRTLMLGFGQLSHLLPENAGIVYGPAVMAAFGACALAAVKAE